MPEQTPTTTVSLALAGAASVAGAFADTLPDQRATWLDAVADALDSHADSLAAIAARETGIDPARLTGEVARTTGQLRLFARVCRDGSFTEAVVDHGDPSAHPPRPDVRRILRGLGPVGIFSAGNFPFAFSVAGGDTASAWAAGCPVVVKAHPGHPLTSRATADLVHTALRETGAPDGVFALVEGVDAGRALVTDPRTRAIGFTGSLAGGRALFDLASGRDEPIPFYGELGSLNPVFVTPAAARRRGAEIAEGFVASMTLADGRMCTKPGLLFAPSGSDLATRAAELAAKVDLEPTLGERVEDGFRSAVGRIRDTPGVTELTRTPEEHGASVFRVDATALTEHGALLEEAFGPASLVVEYDDDSALSELAAIVPGSLAAAIFAEDDEPVMADLVAVVRDRAGRLVWNGWPTGVAVTWGMQHGGPYPATTAVLHTSVGATAIRRWLRPVVYQDWPPALLPSALREGAGRPARIDGALGTL